MAIDNSVYYLVKNRSSSMVVYNIPEDRIRREFAPGETKKIHFEELEHLSYVPGGRELMASFLQIQSEGVRQALSIPAEPEYDMDEAQVKDLLLNGSLDAFLDALDYAPIGVQELIRKYAISLPLSDYEKRQALKNKTGFDIDAAIKNAAPDEETPAAAESAPAAAAKPAGRRTTPNYKVVSKTE